MKTGERERKKGDKGREEKVKKRWREGVKDISRSYRIETDRGGEGDNRNKERYVKRETGGERVRGLDKKVIE